MNEMEEEYEEVPTTGRDFFCCPAESLFQHESPFQPNSRLPQEGRTAGGRDGNHPWF